MKIIKYIGEYECLDTDYLINIRINKVCIFIWRSFLKYKKDIGHIEYIERKYTWFDFDIKKFFTY